MNYKELKIICDQKIKKYPQLEKKYKKEILIARRFYKNNVDLVEILKEKRNNISTRYVIPFLLGLTEKVTDEEFEYKFIEEGSSGGVDIDLDFDPKGKEKIQEYLSKKFGDDRVVHVGTFSKLGPASAAKDLLRIYKCDFKESNRFTKVLQKDKSWEENIEILKENYPQQYQFYLEHKEILDITPYFISKVRQGGKHAGGIVITDEPFYNLIPVNYVQGTLVTAFPESSQEQVLDEIGVVKYDILSISILDVVRNTIASIEEKLFLIEEDGIKKIVGESYIKNN